MAEASQPPLAKPESAEKIPDSIAESEKVVEVKRSDVEISVALLKSNIVKSKQLKATKEQDRQRKSTEKSVKASQEKKLSRKASSVQALKKSISAS